MSSKTTKQPRYETLLCGRCGHATGVLDYLCPTCKRQARRDVFGGKLLRDLPVVSPVARLVPEEGRR